VFGAAQPRSQGLRAILSILRARSTDTSPSHVIWISTREEPIGNTVVCSLAPLNLPYVSLGNLVYISGRPYVLRDSSEPRNTLHLSDRPENLEAIEQRLKNDILAEGVRCGCLMRPVICAILCPPLCRFGGLVLTHNEIGKESAVCVSCDLFNRRLSNRGRRRRHSAYLDRCRFKQCQDFSRTLGIHEKPRLECGGEHLFMSYSKCSK
jgi:hypothetical protein